MSQLQESIWWYLGDQDLTITKFAEISGVGEKTIRLILKHGKVPKIATLQKIADAMNLSVRDILGSQPIQDDQSQVFNTSLGAFTAAIALYETEKCHFLSNYIDQFLKTDSPIEEHEIRSKILRELDHVLSAMKEGDERTLDSTPPQTDSTQTKT